MRHDTLQRLDARTLRETVTSTIRQLILEGELVPGEQVNQAQIAEQLGISRGPVREALSQLEEEGLIRNVPYKGTFVTEITGEYIEELYSFRRVLETFAVRRATERSCDDDFKQLHAIIAGMHTAADAGQVIELGKLDIQYHYTIVNCARHSLLMKTWHGIELGVRRCLTLRHRIYRNPHDIIGTHPDILEAMEARDQERASALLDAHIQEAGELLLESWQAWRNRSDAEHRDDGNDGAEPILPYQSSHK
jgi:DNA-binding GntR family transcriptional regulator